MKWRGRTTVPVYGVSGLIYLTIVFSLLASTSGEVAHHCSPASCPKVDLRCANGVISITNASLSGTWCDDSLTDDQEEILNNCTMQAQCHVKITGCDYSCNCLTVYYDCVVLSTSDQTTVRTTDQTTVRTTGQTPDHTTPAPSATSSTPHSSTTVTTTSTPTTTLPENREGIVAGQAGAPTEDESSQTVGIAVGVSVAMVTIIAVTTFCLIRRRRLRSRDDKLGGVTNATYDPNTTTDVAEPTADVATGNTDTSYVENTEISDSGISTDVATDTEYTTIHEVPDDQYLEPIRTGTHPPTPAGHRESGSSDYNTAGSRERTVDLESGYDRLSSYDSGPTGLQVSRAVNVGLDATETGDYNHLNSLHEGQHFHADDNYSRLQANADSQAKQRVRQMRNAYDNSDLRDNSPDMPTSTSNLQGAQPILLTKQTDEQTADPYYELAKPIPEVGQETNNDEAAATYFILEPEVGNPGTDQSKSSTGTQLTSQQDLPKHQQKLGENLIDKNAAWMQEENHHYLELEDVRK